MEIRLENYMVPSDDKDLKNILSKFIGSPLKEITLETKKMSITRVVEESERYLERKGYKVRIITKGTALASVATAFSTGGLSLIAKVGHLVVTINPDFEIRRNFITGNIDIVKM